MTTCPPCVDSKRARVYRHHAHMFQHMWAWCRYTRGRFEWTHGVFNVPHNTRQVKTRQHNTTRRPQHHTEIEIEIERDRDRDRETGRQRDGETERMKTGTEKRRRKRRDKRRQNKTRQDKTRQDKNAREDARGKTRQDKTRMQREERWWNTRQEKIEERRRETREEKRWRRERKWKTKWREMEVIFFFEKCFKTLKPARWISPTCFEKKSLSDELFLQFFCKSSESGRFSFIYMIRIRFFGPGELIQNYFWGAQYRSLRIPRRVTLTSAKICTPYRWCFFWETTRSVSWRGAVNRAALWDSLPWSVYRDSSHLEGTPCHGGVNFWRHRQSGSEHELTSDILLWTHLFLVCDVWAPMSCSQVARPFFQGFGEYHQSVWNFASTE